MTTAVARASKELKTSTSTIRHHLDAVDRAREVYLGQIKRAESEYFERIKRATQIVAGDDGEGTGSAPASDPTQTQ